MLPYLLRASLLRLQRPDLLLQLLLLLLLRQDGLVHGPLRGAKEEKRGLGGTFVSLVAPL